MSTSSIRVSVPPINDDELIGITLARAFSRRCSTISNYLRN